MFCLVLWKLTFTRYSEITQHESVFPCTAQLLSCFFSDWVQFQPDSLGLAVVWTAATGLTDR